MPKVKISDAQAYTNSATTGVNSNMPDLVENNVSSLLKSVKNFAANKCDNAKYYAIDNYDVSVSEFGQYNNVLLRLSCNVMCIDGY